MVDAARDAEVDAPELSPEAERQSIHPGSPGGGHGFLALVVVAEVASQVGAQIQGHATTQVTKKLIAPDPSVVGDDCACQGIVQVVIRSRGGQVPRFQSLQAKVESERGVGKALCQTKLHVVGQSSIGHDA